MGTQKAKLIRILVSVLSLVLLVTAITGIFAYYVQTDRGYKQEISLTAVFFKLNGKTVGNTLTSDILETNGFTLARGEGKIIELELTAYATVNISSEADYKITFSKSSEYNGKNDLDGDAIEVYLLDGDEFDYVGTLNDLTNGFVISDSMEILPGVNTPNVRNYSFKFVYSQSAGASFDGKEFDLIADATCEISKNTSGKFYVRSLDDLKRAQTEIMTKTTNADGSEKYLYDTIEIVRDITLDDENSATSDDIKFDRNIGIELNGYTLTVPTGKKFEIAYNYDGTDSVGLVAGKRIKYILDDAGVGTVPVVVGTEPVDGQIVGSVNLRTSGDVYFVSDSLAGNIAYLVEEDGTTDFSLERLKDKLGKNATEKQKNIYEFVSTGDSYENVVVNIAKGYRPYLNLVQSGYTVTYEGEGSYSNGNVTFEPAPISHTAIGILSITRGTELVKIGVSIKLRGTTTSAIAEAQMEKLFTGDQLIIDGAVYLPSYDESSGAMLTWISSDHDLLDEHGGYLTIGVDNLTDWADKKIRLGVIVSLAGEQSYFEKEGVVTIFTAKERTERIYYDNAIIVYEEGSTLDFMQKYLRQSELNVKARLKSVTIQLTADAQQANQNSAGAEYIRIENKVVDNISYPTIILVNSPDTAAPVILDTSITFVYDNGDQEISYSLNKQIVVINEGAALDMTDLTIYIQPWFSSNEYIEESIYEFYVDAFYGSVLIDYFTESPYILINNGVYLPESNEIGSEVLPGEGNFYLDGENYIYASARYTRQADGSYIEDSFGSFVVDDEENYFEPGTFYAAKTRFRLLPAMIPTSDVTANISAKIFEPNALPKIYITDASNNDIEYKLTMAIRGIYHNTPEEIADKGVYNALLAIFDGVENGGNGNGYLEVEEAATVYNSEIDLSDMKIDTIKGLEYFTGVSNINLSNNNIINLSYLSRLFSLETLNLSYNKITSLDALAYLDNLTTLDLSYNSISDIEPLRYLPEVNTLLLNGNTSLTDISPLENYTQLTRLEIRGSDAVVNSIYRYLAVTIFNNNPRLAGKFFFGTSSNSFVPNDTEKAAAKALAEVATINNVYTTLNLPTRYEYNGKTYIFEWANDNDPYLVLTNDGSGVLSYQITSPSINRVIRLVLTVKEEGVTETINLARDLYINLLKSPGELAVMVQISDTEAKPIEECVADPSLLTYLFDTYNRIVDGSVALIVNGGIQWIAESRLISFADLESNIASLDLRDKNISSLVGLHYFEKAFSGYGLNVDGIALSDEDYAEIRMLNNITSLTFGGAVIDFRKLLNLNENATTTNATDYVSPFVALTDMYVSGCYELDSDEVKAALYINYLQNPQLRIFLTDVSETAAEEVKDEQQWNPYIEVLPYYVFALPSSYVFIDYGETHLLTEGFEIDFYGVNKVPFTVSDVKYYHNASSSNSNPTYSNKSPYFENITTGGKITAIRLHTLANSTLTEHARLSLLGTDNCARNEEIIADKITRLQAEFNSKIRIYEPENSEYADVNGKTLLEVFPGRTIREQVLYYIGGIINASAATSLESLGNACYHDQENDLYYMSIAGISNAVRITEITSVGQYDVESPLAVAQEKNALGGLRYLKKVTKLHIIRDADIGDGADLVNLTDLQITYSGADFTHLTTTLDKLTTIKIGIIDKRTAGNCRYVRLHKKQGGVTTYYLNYIPNLQVLQLRDCAIYDWEFLNAFLQTKDDGTYVNKPLSTLIIYASWGAYSNRNNNLTSTELIVRQIYNRYVADNSASTANYQIGTPDNARVNTKYTGVWTDATGGYNFVPDYQKEYADLFGSIADVGLKVNDSFYFDTRDDIIDSTQNVSITLPTALSDYVLGGTYTDTTFDEKRNFAVDWRICGVENESVLSNIFGGLPTDIPASAVFKPSIAVNDYKVYDIPNTAKDSNGNIVLTVKNQASDYYLLIIGTIGLGYYDENNNYCSLGGTPKSFVYPLLIKANANTITSPSDGLSYGVIEDAGLRLYMYLGYSSAKLSLSGLAVCMGYISNSLNTLGSAAAMTELEIVKADNKTVFNNGVNSGIRSLTTFAGSSAYSVLNENIVNMQSSISSLNGMYNLPTLVSLAIEQNDVANIDGLVSSDGQHYASGLSKLYLYDNLISDVDVLKHFSSLTDVRLAHNPILTLREADNSSIFSLSADSITTLDISNVEGATAADITALAGAMTDGVTKAFNLSAANTAGIGDFELLTALYDIADKRSIGSIGWSVVPKSQYNEPEYNAVNTTYLKLFIDNFRLLTANSSNSGTWNEGAVSLGYSQAELNSYYHDQIAYGGKNLLVTKKVSVVGFPENLFAYSTVENVQSANVEYTINDTLKIEQFEHGLFLGITNGRSLNAENFSFTDSSLSITANWGIMSLKGLNLLTSLTTVTITNNRLTSLWGSESFPSLTSLTLGASPATANDVNVPVIRLSAQDVYNSISGCTNLRTLDLRYCAGIDYYAEITDRNGQKTTLIEYLTSSTSTIRNLYISCVDPKLGVDENSHEFLNRIADGTQTFVSGGKTFNNFANLEAFKVNYTLSMTEKIFGSLDENYLYKKNLTDTLTNGSLFNHYRYTFNLKTRDFLAAFANLSTSLTVTIGTDGIIAERFPDRIYDYDIDTYGLYFDLPQSMNVFGTKYDITWTVNGSKRGDKGTANYIKNGKFYVDSTNYATGGNDDMTITLYASAMGQTVSFPITVVTTPVMIDSPNHLPDYFVKLMDGTIVRADDVFESGRLIYFLYNSTTSTINSGGYVRKSDGTNITLETTFTFAGRDYSKDSDELSGYLLNAADVAMINIQAEGNTSLIGLDIFDNLTHLTIRDGFNVDLVPLGRLTKLKVFEFQNSSTGNPVADIMDFSPLLSSKATLETFEYNYHANTHIFDLSFLTCFENLKTVTLGYDTSSAALIQYLMTGGFRYVLSQLSEAGVTVRINRSYATNTDLIYLYGDTVVGNYYILNTSASVDKAVSIFDDFVVPDAVYDEDGYWLTVSDNFVLPAYIDHGGAPYIVTYAPLTKQFTLDTDFTIRLKNDTAFYIDGVLTTFKDGDKVTYAQFEQIVAQKSFRELEMAKLCSVGIEGRFVTKTKDTAMLEVKISVDGYFYEKTIALDTKDTAHPDFYSADLFQRVKFARIKAMYSIGKYTTEAYEEILSIYNTALADLSAESLAATRKAIYDKAVADMLAAVTTT